MKNTTNIGKVGEDWASLYLKNRGLVVIGRNYRTRFGEIDIIAKDAEALVFVEVKRKTQSVFGEPYEMVTPKKKEKLINMSRYYLTDKGIGEDANWRIDIISIDWNRRIEWIKNAITD